MAYFDNARLSQTLASDKEPTEAEEACLVDLAVEAVREHVGDFRPEVMITFGSGLSGAARPIEMCHQIPYSKIPGFAAPSAAGHPGRIGFGYWHDRRVVAFLGRLHCYEGHSWRQVTLPVMMAHELGAAVGLFTNMSGAVNPKLAPGSLVIIDDHMNFMDGNPILGMTGFGASDCMHRAKAYSPRLRMLLNHAAQMAGVPINHGVYVGVRGPNYETPAEIRAFRLLGADIIGMSTVGEVTSACQRGMECCAISCVSNYAAGITNEPISHDDVLQRGREATVHLSAVLDMLMKVM